MSKPAIDLDSMTATALADYRESVKAVASGGQIPDQKALLQTLVLAGKSLADFQADVKSLRERFAAVEQMRQADAMQAEIQAALSRCEQAEAELKAALEERKRVVDAAAAKSRKCQQTAADLQSRQLDLRSQADQALAKTADPQLQARIRELCRGVARDRALAKHFETQYQAQVKAAEGDKPGDPPPRARNVVHAQRVAEADRELEQLRQQQVNPFEGNAWTTRMAKAEALTA